MDRINSLEEFFFEDKFTSWEYATKLLSGHLETTKLILIYKDSNGRYDSTD